MKRGKLDASKGAPRGRLGRRLASERILMQVALRLQHELPIRLAHRIQDLDQVPHLKSMPSVQKVKSIYIASFLELLQQLPPDTHPLEGQFGAILQKACIKNIPTSCCKWRKGPTNFGRPYNNDTLFRLLVQPLLLLQMTIHNK
jgi:hypothetical protein